VSGVERLRVLKKYAEGSQKKYAEGSQKKYAEGS